MLRENLYKKLNYTTALREHRGAAADWVMQNPGSFKFLFELILKEDSEVSHKAAWVLEFVCIRNMELLLPHLKDFLEIIPQVKKNQAKRPLAKLAELLCLAYYKKKDPQVLNNLRLEYRKAITEQCFDWLINEEKVACKAYSIQSLYWLGTEFDWIHPELEIILADGYSKHTAAFKARAREFLSKIERYRTKNRP